MVKVITYGTYDLLHYGHIRLLERAKKLGDYLIVGVSTDEVVKSYKNKTPIIPFEERSEIVRSIDCVDKVIPQVNRDKYEAWKELKFDVMFVGDDWKGKPLFMKVEDDFRKVGVEVVYFPYTKDTSSTILREKLGCK